MSLKLDDLDIHLLSILQREGRIPLNELSNRIGLSTPTVRKRIERLIELGVIKMFTVVVDKTKFRETISVFLIIEGKPEKIRNIGEKLAEYPEITEVYVVTGDHNLVAKAFIDDIDKLQTIIREISTMPDVYNIHASLINDTIKEESGIQIKPGTGIKVYCSFCGKLIEKSPKKLIHNNRTLYFCCDTCLSEFKKKHKSN